MIFIITASFPYPPGEQFLEAEIPVWGREYSGKIILLPVAASGKQRPIPDGVEMSHALVRQYRSVFRKGMTLLASIASPIFWLELKNMAVTGKLTLRRAYGALKTTTHVKLVKKGIEHAARKFGNPDIVYTYWFGPATYAATSLRSRPTVVTRAHGGDLYEFRHPQSYLYLRRQFINEVDRIYPISRDGSEYLSKQYGAHKNKVHIINLGVNTPDRINLNRYDDRIDFISISNCIPLKNIDKIIDAISHVSDKIPSVEISWRHIGDGVCRSLLEERATQAFHGKKINWKFLGQLDNSKVIEQLDSASPDMLVNASSSEGIPVSIMEAMSRGIPAVAPAVGGIPELVSEKNGILLGPDPSAAEMAEAITGRLNDIKSPELRKAAADTIRTCFNAEVNYRNFIRNIVSLSKPSWR